MIKKTKIICTQGPSTDQPGVVEQLIEHGMNLARFNFSHGTHEDHLMRINRVRDAAKKLGKVVSLVLDTKGPEVRLGEFKDGTVLLEAGKKFVLTQSDEPGDATHCSVSHKKLYTEVKPGDKILLSDGLVECVVKAINGQDIETEILNTGKMSTRKRVAVPGVSLGLPAISDQDRDDLIFGVENDMDFVAASFIQRASDVQEIRDLIDEHGGHMEIIPKIENLEGVKNIDEIIEIADGIMVARGDLGVEIPAEDVPIIQKEIIRKCNAVGKPVIVATQMLESMTTNPRPTRAEVSDVGNAIFDGADAVMLSGETASGKYPVEAVSIMNQIALRTESALDYREIFQKKGMGRKNSRTEAIAHATVQIAYELNAKAIITPTRSGYTTNVVSKYRPKATILALTPDDVVARHMNLRWGVFAVSNIPWLDLEKLTDYCTDKAKELEVVEKGDLAILTSGIKSGGDSTSSIRVVSI